MDKQIIIDGVDVSGCNFRLEREEKQKCECCHATGFGVICDCENWHNCNYKQLQRAKAEIEELKKQVKNNETAYHTELGTYNMECGNLLEENKNLIAENERLKKDKIGLHSEIKQLEQENFELKESLKCFQTPESIKALTFYKTGEFELQEKKCIKLEQENERLKEVNDSFMSGEYCANGCKKMNNAFQDLIQKNEQLKEESEQLHNDLKECGIKREQYRQALQEIKRYIAVICKEECGYVQQKRCLDADCRYGQILAKINEVIGAEE